MLHEKKIIIYIQPMNDTYLKKKKKRKHTNDLISKSEIQNILECIIRWLWKIFHCLWRSMILSNLLCVFCPRTFAKEEKTHTERLGDRKQTELDKSYAITNPERSFSSCIFTKFTCLTFIFLRTPPVTFIVPVVLVTLQLSDVCRKTVLFWVN